MSFEPPSVLAAAKAKASQPLPAVGSWGDLVNLPTLDLPLPVFVVWVETDTGRMMKTRLIYSTEETNQDAGIYRPRDYNPNWPRVWFLAG